MKKLFLGLLAGLVISFGAYAGVDPIAQEKIQDIQQGADNANRIEKLLVGTGPNRVVGNTTNAGNLVVTGAVTVGGAFAASGAVTAPSASVGSSVVGTNQTVAGWQTVGGGRTVVGNTTNSVRILTGTTTNTGIVTFSPVFSGTPVVTLFYQDGAATNAPCSAGTITPTNFTASGTGAGTLGWIAVGAK